MLPLSHARGATFGLAAAALFGISAPLAKLLLADVAPVLLAGLLYLGASSALWAHRITTGASREAPLARGDLAPLGIVVLVGGIAAPVLMLVGLARMSGLAGALLLNLEAPFTVMLAVFFFREHLGRQALLATLLIFGGAIALSMQGGNFAADPPGVLFLALACLCWALDNNLTQQLSARDPFAIVRVKTSVAGIVNLGLGLVVARGHLPSFRYVAGALVLGGLSYGLSLLLDTYALRLVGAAREAAYFATAPFMGAAISVALLRDQLTPAHAVAMVLMALGVVALLSDQHGHAHTHDTLVHEHLHEHDVHHLHEHNGEAMSGEPHSHAHSHEPMRHAHLHASDAHHRHKH